MSNLSRRDFVAAGSVLAARVALGQSSQSTTVALTAGEVIARIKKQVGVPWFPQTVDNLLTGSPETPVRGIATTMMATLEVVEHCAALGKNMIVTHETPFYMHQDHTDDIKDDPTLLYKLDFCKKHDIAIFHFHDHWHARHPDGIAQGMINQLGWQKNVNDAADPKTMRVMGDPALPVRRAETSWGYCGREGGIKIFSQPDVDVLICGETREWELVEYCQDSIQEGNKKALIVVGHVLSEQGGMILCADWLKGFIPEAPIEFVVTPEPFWNAEYPPRA
jgi:putative NIF3 family GTP cyclohydrolase 1 type 2